MSAERRAELLGHYRLALDEYRFNVQLGWDRTKSFLLLNSALLAAAAGLIRLDADPVARVTSALVLVVGVLTSLLGAASSSKSHEYYRAAAIKKAFVERELGYFTPLEESADPLACLALSTTRGMREHDHMLAAPGQWLRRPERPGSILWATRSLFYLFALLNSAGLAAVILSLAR